MHSSSLFSIKSTTTHTLPADNHWLRPCRGYSIIYLLAIGAMQGIQYKNEQKMKERYEMKKNKILALLMAVVLVGTLFAACSGKSEPSTTTPESSKGESATGDTAADPSETSGDRQLLLGMQQSPNIENLETNYMTKKIEEDKDVALEFMIFPADGEDFRTKLALMVSSQSELPEVMNTAGLSTTVAFDYAQKGVFADLTEYMADPEKTPYYHENVPEDIREIMEAGTRMPDGKQYALPRYNPFHWNESPHRFWVNTTWMDALDMEVPTNTEEFYQAAKAMKEQDPNGNGKADEIPIVGSSDGWGQRPFVYLMNAFVYANPDKNYFSVENGKIVPSYTSDEWKEGLEYIKMLVDENLFDSLSFTQDGTQLNALIDQETSVVGFFSAGSSAVPQLPHALGHYDLMGPIEGPNGNRTAPYNPSMPVNTWYITRDAKNVDLAVEIGDYFYDPAMSMSNRYGEEGVEWSIDPEIAEKWMSQTEEKLGNPTIMAKMVDIWNEPQNKMWLDIGPGYRSLLQGESVGIYEKETGPPEGVGVGYISEFIERTVPYFPEEFITSLQYTPEETEAIANAKTAIDSYVYDQAVAFITGNRSLEEWDTYLQELEDMGLEDYVNAAQAAFDRSQ